MKGILCFGDSITWGRGESPNIGWCGRLKKDFEKLDPFNVCYNLGICGDNSKNLLERIENECKSRIKYLREQDEFYILLNVGLNDIKKENTHFNVDIKTYELNLNKIVGILKKYSQNIILITSTKVNENITKDFEGSSYFNKDIKEYNLVIQKIAIQNNFQIIDLYPKLKKENLSEILFDGLHPNKKGYELIYSIIKKELYFMKN